MGKITTYNYEAYFLDFLEGNLSKEKCSELKRFLNANPRLKEELDEFEAITLEPETVTFSKKEELIKNTQAKHFEINEDEYLIVADIENDNTEEEKQQLHKRIYENSILNKDFQLFKLAKLKPDLKLIYTKKAELLKRSVSFYIKTGLTAAAAIVALIIAVNLSGVFNALDNQQAIVLKACQDFNKIKQSQSLQINDNNQKQEALLSHNQTNKQTISDLAFEDNEPQYEETTYKELTVTIPEIKHEALVLRTSEPLIENIYAYNTSNQSVPYQKKDAVWQYAETGINVWRLISSSNLEMNNQYNEHGRIEKLNLTASNFKLSRTFYKE